MNRQQWPSLSRTVPAWVAVFLGLPLALSCASDDHHADEAASAALADVVYAGTASDEALEAVLDVTPTKVAGKGAVLDSPAQNGTWPADAPATFAWHLQTAAAPARHRPTQAAGQRQVMPYGTTPLLRRTIALWQVQQAWAHGTPTSGKAYWLVVSSASNPKLLRVFTTAKSYTPTAAQRQQLAAAQGPLQAVLVTATMDTNKLVDGPYASEPVLFTVK